MSMLSIENFEYLVSEQRGLSNGITDFEMCDVQIWTVNGNYWNIDLNLLY